MMGYGEILVGGDYAGKLTEIAEVLNTLDFGEGIEFEADGDYLSVDDPYGEYCYAIPYRAVMAFSDGRRIYRKGADPAVIAEWEKEAGPTYSVKEEEVSPEWLSDNVAPLVTKGALQIVANYSEGAREACWSRLVIHSNGVVECQAQHHYSDGPSRQWNDAFDPRKQEEAGNATQPNGFQIRLAPDPRRAMSGHCSVAGWSRNQLRS
jgi:hypothetical protein